MAINSSQKFSHNEVILNFNRQGFTHVRISALRDQVRCYYGVKVVSQEYGWPVESLNTYHTETYKYKDHHELMALHDGFGWNYGELMIFYTGLQPDIG